ncbi:acyltransferase-like protein [Trichocladium antarcticum]|uniref:Acyltransferase-like protein n=1 Tax=Trichocladium antarcticum TaxID=1450529 RepID=A0AAN6UEU5_9PEZI|nr:acyltransferase-like protein [Trichocladium antarcticum]
MNNHGYPADDEEKMMLLDARLMSDAESDAGMAGREPKSSGRARQSAWQTQALVHSPRLALRRIGIFLLPSFVQARLSHGPRCRASSAQPGPTAYLDGMRGLAALVVFFCHFSYTCFIIAPGWGFEDGNRHFLTLPFIRLVYSGPPMVCVFFVVSGYALSLKPLQLARSGRFDAFAATMSSVTFRRIFRLFLPIAASTLLIVALVRLGLYEWTRDFANDDHYLRNVQELHYERKATTAEQLWDWAGSLCGLIHVWDWELFGGSTPIDLHLWTIPVEFRCSMMLFLTLMGTARLKTALRLAVVALLVVFCYAWSRWDMILFYAGMLLAEADLIRGAHGPPTTPSQQQHQPPLPPPPSLPTPSPTWPTALSILALYLMSQPDHGGRDTPGWAVLTALIPRFWTEAPHRHWQSLGAALFVLAVGRSPAWQRLFCSRPAQYLGRISYALYLMHGPVLHTAGYAVMRAVWAVVGTEGGWYAGGFAVAAVVVVPGVVWAADVFWRAVDAPVVRFAKWLEGRCVVE